MREWSEPAPWERSVESILKLRSSFAALMCAAALTVSSCGLPEGITELTEETTFPSEASENLVVNGPAAYGLSNDLEGAAYDEPFSSYTYDFSSFENNYMITVVPDEKRTGLELTIEDNEFGYSKFSVIPPDGYMVGLPYSQQFASRVCTVIKSEEGDGQGYLPDLLKIDFYLMEFEDESLPYSVSRLYSIKDGIFTEIEVYNTEPPELDETADTSETGAEAAVYAGRSMDIDPENYLEPMDYIPESELYQTTTNTFMPEPKVTVLEDGSLETEIITYTMNSNDMTMRREKQDCTPDNTLYYGYAAYAEAKYIYQYFATSNLNVADDKSYVKVPAADGGEDKYFFKVDDSRFSTKAELEEYVSRRFDEQLVKQMFLKAPQQYRDIDGALYTLLGDGGVNEELGKLTITSYETEDNIITYHTKQEKYNSEQTLDGYVNGGDFVIEVKDDGGFIVKEYRYPME